MNENKNDTQDAKNEPTEAERLGRKMLAFIDGERIDHVVTALVSVTGSAILNHFQDEGAKRQAAAFVLSHAVDLAQKAGFPHAQIALMVGAQQPTTKPKPKVRIKRLSPEARIPEYATPGAACFDLHSITEGSVTEGTPLVCDTGLAFEIPEGHVMLIYSRSGHGFKNDTRLSNCVGVIDADYRGEVKVKLTKDSLGGVLNVTKGDRIAQAMVVPVDKVTFEEVDELGSTERGQGGFGSTGA